MNCNIEYSNDDEIVITRKHTTGETILVIEENGDIMVSFSSNEHPDKGWIKFDKKWGVKEYSLKNMFELFNKEE